MKSTIFTFLSAFFAVAFATAIPSPATPSALAAPVKGCNNTATSRNCWGDYSIDTNWYEEHPRTGVTREYWLSVENTTLAPDGYERQTLTFNGTIPGPAIIANWGDDIVVHVKNNLEHNGTSVHWHGMVQKENSEFDGVPGVTQCPIAPGDSLTYRFPATQYGTTWYHSHFTLQYADGLLGPLIINGPATANYDVDLGPVLLSDWAHESVFNLWQTAMHGAPPVMENNLINGTNTFDCSSSSDAKCLGTGSRFETTFTAGKTYRMRLINTATDAHFRFSMDNHTFSVIAMDLVPIVPYETDNLLISIGQRYDIVVTASAGSGNYWLRSGWQTACNSNASPNNAVGIIRYDSSSTDDPVSTSDIVSLAQSCYDEPLENLVPHVPITVGASVVNEELALAFAVSNVFTWTINTSSLYLNWSAPTTLKIYNNESIFPTPYNVVPLPQVDEWVYIIIQDSSGIGLSHPIHLHGHDMNVIAQDTGIFDINTTPLNLNNPPRRDVATLPGNGFLAMAFKTDNPGSWITHCHIAWHASQGLALQFVEREDEIAATLDSPEAFLETCKTWDEYTPGEIYLQDDSGI